MTDKLKMWRDMTPEEKGALLLAEHEGKKIEIRWRGEWIQIPPNWADNRAYRVRPERETVTLYGSEGKLFSKYTYHTNTLCITYEIEDGEADCASVRMEKIK